VYVAAALVQAGMVTRAELTGLPWVEGGVTDTSDEASIVTPYDVILMDIVMPLSDGADICHGLRALRGKWSTIPIIAATGNAPDDAGLLRSGFTMVLRKPFTLDHLRDAIEEVCTVRESAPQLQTPTIATAAATT
jgi:CheY-like chemotaxis protein